MRDLAEASVYEQYALLRQGMQRRSEVKVALEAAPGAACSLGGEGSRCGGARPLRASPGILMGRGPSRNRRLLRRAPPWLRCKWNRLSRHIGGGHRRCCESHRGARRWRLRGGGTLAVALPAPKRGDAPGLCAREQL